MKNLKLPLITDKTLQKFYNRVVFSDENSCWYWKGVLSTKNGYGRITINGKKYLVPRVSYYIYYTVDPGEKLVCHKCDNPRCCNPIHLFLGTYQDNSKDAYNKGRIVMPERRPFGSSHGKAKLTELAVEIIRVLVKEKRITDKTIAKVFNVSKTTINDIKLFKKWQHVK